MITFHSEYLTLAHLAPRLITLVVVVLLMNPCLRPWRKGA